MFHITQAPAGKSASYLIIIVTARQGINSDKTIRRNIA
jgi:hypothetical protein